MRGGRKLVGGAGQDAGPGDPRARRDMQRGVSGKFPVRVKGSAVEIQVNPRGAIETDPALGLGVRAGEGLAVASASPYALHVVAGSGTKIRNGRVVAATSSSVRLDASGNLIATPTTKEVIDPDGGTAYATLARKANVSRVEDLETWRAAVDPTLVTLIAASPIAYGVATLVAGTVAVAIPAVVTGATVVVCHAGFAGTPGLLSWAVTDGVGIDITSLNVLDESTVSYAVWNP